VKMFELGGGLMHLLDRAAIPCKDCGSRPCLCLDETEGCTCCDDCGGCYALCACDDIDDPDFLGCECCALGCDCDDDGGYA
jgi:hypothetical protein